VLSNSQPPTPRLLPVILRPLLFGEIECQKGGSITLIEASIALRTSILPPGSTRSRRRTGCRKGGKCERHRWSPIVLICSPAKWVL